MWLVLRDIFCWDSSFSVSSLFLVLSSIFSFLNYFCQWIQTHERLKKKKNFLNWTTQNMHTQKSMGKSLFYAANRQTSNKNCVLIWSQLVPDTHRFSVCCLKNGFTLKMCACLCCPKLYVIFGVAWLTTAKSSFQSDDPSVSVSHAVPELSIVPSLTHANLFLSVFHTPPKMGGVQV